MFPSTPRATAPQAYNFVHPLREHQPLSFTTTRVVANSVHNQNCYTRMPFHFCSCACFWYTSGNHSPTLPSCYCITYQPSREAPTAFHYSIQFLIKQFSLPIYYVACFLTSRSLFLTIGLLKWYIDKFHPAVLMLFQCSFDRESDRHFDDNKNDWQHEYK